MTTALLPGSFDPPTNGHFDVIERVATLFDHVIVSVIDNPAKTPLFSAEQRARMLDEIHGDSIEVRVFSGLLVDHVRETGADLVVKGLRAVDDYEYESQMAQMNRHLTGMETVLIPTRPEFGFVSSTLVREVASLGGSTSGLVPDVVEKALKERFS